MDGIREMTLFIADDHEAFCRRLGEMLGETEGIRVIGHARNAADAIRSISQLKPDVVVLDIRMPPGAGGFDVLRKIKERVDCPRVIMLTAFSNAEYKKKSMAMGADHYFDKSSDLKRMLMTIRGLVSEGIAGK